MPSRVVGSFVVLALLLAVGTLTYYLQAPAAAPVTSQSEPVAPSPTLAVVNAARDLKLITWSFDTTLDATSINDRWYGDARAEVRAPVRYQYGLDLTSLSPDDVVNDAGTGAYVFLVAPPKRLSTEVNIARLEESLHVSGLRWRSNNKDQIEAARKQLAKRAEKLVLSDADERRLRDASREQLELHLNRVLEAARVGGRAVVRFAD